MCLFIYTVSACNHTSFQNVAECPVAQGLADSPGARRDLTLPRPKFLFDTAQSRSRTPDYYKAAFDCPKRRAVRPVAGPCRKCVGEQRLAAAAAAEEALEAPPAVVCGVAGSGSAGSEVALMTASSY